MTRRERLSHPLDDVPSIKLKLGFVIGAAVSIALGVGLIRIARVPADEPIGAAGTAQDSTSVVTDIYGDPLPPGAS